MAVPIYSVNFTDSANAKIARMAYSAVLRKRSAMISAAKSSSNVLLGYITTRWRRKVHANAEWNKRNVSGVVINLGAITVYVVDRVKINGRSRWSVLDKGAQTGPANARPGGFMKFRPGYTPKTLGGSGRQIGDVMYRKSISSARKIRAFEMTDNMFKPKPRSVVDAVRDALNGG